MPPTDRLLEARKTYADLAAAGQSLRNGRVLRRTWVIIIVPVVLGSFLGFLLGSAAADAWPWLLPGQEPR